MQQYFEQNTVEVVLGGLMILSLIWTAVAVVLYWKIVRQIRRQKDTEKNEKIVLREMIERRGYTELPVPVSGGPLRLRKRA